MKNQTIEQAVEEIVSTVETVEFLHGVPVNLPSQYKADLRGVARKALQDQRDAGGRERKGWKAYAVVDAETDNYLYKGFFLNRKDAEKSWENDLSGTKGLVIIEVDVYPAITPPTK